MKYREQFQVCQFSTMNNTRVIVCSESDSILSNSRCLLMNSEPDKSTKYTTYTTYNLNNHLNFNFLHGREIMNLLDNLSKLHVIP